MREAIFEALTWALALDPATLKWPAAVLVALAFGLVLFGLVQYQAFNRPWGIQLVLGLAGGAVVAGLGAAIHWFLGVLYGVGYLLTWLVWVLTRHWHWWRRALTRGLAAGLTLGPWLWLGATERDPWTQSLRYGSLCDMIAWLATPSPLMCFWMVLGGLWLLAFVGGWGCWHWSMTLPKRRRWVVAAWALLAISGLNWYAAGRVDLFAACREGQHWRLGYVLVSRPGSQWYRGAHGYTPLHGAARNDNAKVLRLLLAAGANNC